MPFIQTLPKSLKNSLDERLKISRFHMIQLDNPANIWIFEIVVNRFIYAALSVIRKKSEGKFLVMHFFKIQANPIAFFRNILSDREF